ncbi:ABC transporter ATP-binding protein [Pseudomonas vanderleydeniana]|uniref:ABC transporter ATP-binding protein n=1 Tax=Pseudomonas vanderleydeniana TaxID=2745495 RepID=A0A9E6PPV5_9PSED|nr:ABC transporter ATP-binding protein [Pseudomonas vanderleydeniana]QXI30469.1 ABC transporter ATP-binding protein [Pseudomonas vanderleydeniana]
MSSEIVLCVEGLSKCYRSYGRPRDRLLQMLPLAHGFPCREFRALENVSFEMNRGEAIGVVGRKGAGKSTLLQLICTTLSPTSGSVFVNGRVAALLEFGAGFNPRLTGRENVYMVATLHGLGKDEIDQRFSAIAAFADIGGFMEQPVSTYSKGMHVRLAFAVIAHVDADILLIDEVLAIADGCFVERCLRFLHGFKQRNSVIVVSDDTAAIIDLCDRVIWLDRGTRRQLGEPGAVCGAYRDDLAVSTKVGRRSDTDEEGQPSTPFGPGVSSGPARRIGEINARGLVADLQVFRFDPGASGTFGGWEARIVRVGLNDLAGVGLTWVSGGERVALRVEAQVHVQTERPVIGFSVKDSLGQTLFGDHVCTGPMGKPGAAAAGAWLTVEFEFLMPRLARGDYVIQVAIADGERNDHRQLHWCDEALLIRSHHDPLAEEARGIALVDNGLNMGGL